MKTRSNAIPTMSPVRLILLVRSCFEGRVGGFARGATLPADTTFSISGEWTFTASSSGTWRVRGNSVPHVVVLSFPICD